jgi:hypothetical protein
MAIPKLSGKDTDLIQNKDIVGILRSIEIQVKKIDKPAGEKLEKTVHDWDMKKTTVKDYNKFVELANKEVVRCNNLAMQAAAKAKTEEHESAEDEDESDGGWKLSGKTTVPANLVEASKAVWEKFAAAVKSGKHPKHAAKIAGDTNYKCLSKPTSQYEIRLNGADRATFLVHGKIKECEVKQIGGHT